MTDSTLKTEEFQRLVWDYYQTSGRDLPWRSDHSPYSIVVSELMLQQTQVSRVIPKFQSFLEVFPTWTVLVKASLAEVLKVWSGLGYNRRARYLHDLAKSVVKNFGGQLPQQFDQLIKLPGIGPNTAGAILVYAFNQPVVFVETNIRTVFIHHFFADAEQVTDSQLRPLIEQTFDHEHPREWGWALMDYGAFLKNQGIRSARRSHHHTTQSQFKGSLRQIRGQVIRLLAERNLTKKQLAEQISDKRLEAVLASLLREGLISQQRAHYHLPS